MGRTRPSRSAAEAVTLYDSSIMFSQIRDVTSLSPPKFPKRVPSMEAGLCAIGKDDTHGMLSSKTYVVKDCASVDSFDKPDDSANCYAWIIGFSEEDSVTSDVSDQDISCYSSSTHHYVPAMMEQDLLGNLGLSRWISNDSSADSRSRNAPKTPSRTAEDAFQFSDGSDV